MQLESEAGGFTLSLSGHVLIRHRPDAPCFFAGLGDPRITMRNGFFDIQDYVTERIPLRHVTATRQPGGWRLDCSAGAGSPAITVEITGSDDRACLSFSGPGLNRLWIRLLAEPGERLYGAGEQFSYLDLAGRRFPLWVAEPGVGRDPATWITHQAAQDGRAGDDTLTYYPQPSFLSSRGYAAHLDTTAFAALDFRRPEFHELECWTLPTRLELFSAPTTPALVQSLSRRFGPPPGLPAWTDKGAIIGLKDGEYSFDRLDRIIESGIPVSGLWCEDWAGVKETSFGTRLFWNWAWDPDRYPNLPDRVAALRGRDIRFLAYANPYLNDTGALYAAARQQGLLIRDHAGAPYRVDFGGFTGGMLDLTNPEAAQWFIDRILRGNMLDLGVSGWMADFGEFLAPDTHLHAGDPLLLHNAWPVLWAELNARAIAEAGCTGDILFFMRAGHTGIQRHCPLLWGGDQLVDFSRHDGLPSAICAALSSGLMGNPYHHTDIGGYMSLYGARRTPELFMRWAEMAAFTAVMRTHEGNRPRDNIQLDSSPELLAHFARMARLFVALTPYRRRLAAEAATGLPLQRPLFLHFPDDPAAQSTQDQFLLGPDLLIAPVKAEAARSWPAYLPAGADWTHLWTRKNHRGGQTVTVPAPLGQPPAFFRADSPHAALFQSLPDAAA